MPIKYLIADVDDTFTVAGFLHPQVLATVARAAAAGIEVILNTGRPAGYGAALLQYVDGVSAVVVENGGAWLDRRLLNTSDKEVALQYRVSPPPDLRQRLQALSERAALRVGLQFSPTADNAYRLTDYTVLRALPKDVDAAVLLAALAEHVAAQSDGVGRILASSIHIHFMLDPRSAGPRSKADGVAALLARRGVKDPDAELQNFAIAVGDSANDASLFAPGRFALSVGVRNIEPYLPELGTARPARITRAAEGLGLIELIDDLLSNYAGI